METTTILSYCIAGTLCAIGYVVFKHFTPRREKEEQTHVFLDLETLGTAHDAPVLVVAAYAVNEKGDPAAAAVWRVDTKDAAEHGRTDPATMQWWAEQSSDARYAAFEEGPRLPLASALKGLEGFLRRQKGTVFIWGNAPTFDCAILRHAYAQVGHETPWEFWQERDCRTVAAIGEWIGYDAKQCLEFEGERHIALDDARHQARYTMSILEYLGGR